MNLHEYQAKQLFAEYGIAVQEGMIAHNGTEARDNAQKLGGDAWLVKAQVHAGGRGKAGGVKFTKDLQEDVLRKTYLIKDECKKAVKELLQNNLELLKELNKALQKRSNLSENSINKILQK